MMTRKKKRVIILSVIMVLLLIVGVTVVLLYMNTDMLKSNSTLFAQYMGQNIENIDEIYHSVEKSKYEEWLQNNKYTMQTQIKVNYTENRGTTSENTQNEMNRLKIEMEGETDPSNQYNHQDITLLKEDEKIAQAEYIRNKNTYGVKFSDLFNPYILVNNENLKDLFEKAGFTQEELNYLPERIEIEESLYDVFQFSEEEKQSLQSKYINIINTNIEKDKFSKQKNQTIQIDGKRINVNAYALILTKEQMNHLYLKLLEELKQDEIILNKVDKLQSILDTYPIQKKSQSLRDLWMEEIENVSNDIIRNNIGQEEAKIIVYENYHTTKRTVIQNPDYEITIDLLSSQEENYAQISYQNKISEQEKTFTFRYKGEETSIALKDTKNGETTEYGLMLSEEINGNRCQKEMMVTYEDEKNKIETIITQTIQLVNDLEETIVLDKDNSINLNGLQESQLKSILEQINNGVSEKISEITTQINMEDIENVLKVLGIIKENQSFEVTGITETEKNRYNSKFEILQGENLESVDVLRLIESIKDNLLDIEMVSNKELKLKLDRTNKNEEMATILINFMENNKNQSYNTKVEYDEETGLISDILLTIVEKNR